MLKRNGIMKNNDCRWKSESAKADTKILTSIGRPTNPNPTFGSIFFSFMQSTSIFVNSPQLATTTFTLIKKPNQAHLILYWW